MTTTLLRRWLVEEDGQDLIEYGLLASFVGFTMFAAALFLGGAMKSTYTSWDTTNQDDQLVEIPDPQ